MVALLLILRDCGIAAKNTLFKHFLRSDRPQLSSACTKNQLSNVPSEMFNLKRNRPRNLHEQICNFREQVVRAGCKLLRANCQSKYQHCGGSLQSCAEKNIRFDCNYHASFVLSQHSVLSTLLTIVIRNLLRHFFDDHFFVFRALKLRRIVNKT